MMRAASTKATYLLAMLALLVALLGVLSSCGSAHEEEAAAEETEELRLDGVSYRVTMFRELNRNIAPDAAILEHAGDLQPRRGYYAAFVVACNSSSSTRTPSDQVHLENAFGDTIKPLGLSDDSVYDARALPPGRCVPRDDSLADRGLPGAPVVFEVPYGYAEERPLYLVIGDEDGRRELRVELDL